MVFDYDGDCKTPPKLALFSFPAINRNRHESPGMVTPPIHTAASVPFHWEEAPGKPRFPGTDPEAISNNVVRCLELPPRLVSTENSEITKSPSPTTVLDGPYLSRSLSTTSASFRKGGSSLRKFRESTWGSFRKCKDAVDGRIHGACSDDKALCGGFDGGGGGFISDCKGKFNRIRRRGSFSGFSHSKSHLLTSIYESLKQVIPWRRGEERMKKKSLNAISTV